jgi:hypothetical protein
MELLEIKNIKKVFQKRVIRQPSILEKVGGR